MEFKVNINALPLEALIILAASQRKVTVTVSGETCLVVQNNVQFTSNISAMRYLANTDQSNRWMGSNALERCEINHWITYSFGPLSSEDNFEEALNYLDRVLAPVTYLVGNQCTLADIVVWSKLFNLSKWIDLLQSKKTPINVTRWYSFIASLKYVEDAVIQVKSISANLPAQFKVKEEKLSSAAVLETGRKDEGKFVDLPGAEMGKVVVRFPPEASGYLHIGHAKAALLNQYYKEAFKGQLIMRFDDTNPAKEKEDFERVILEDLKLLKINYDRLTRTSDYFELMLELCEKLINEGKAYVDDTNAEEMKKEREKKICSKNRENSVEKNMKMWNDMKTGSEKGQLCCVRAKIDMSSLNGCMRDPTIYRCKNEPHPQTGEKYKVYPTYDFACPIVDSIEGVTHCLRTMEYHDRDEQFYWFIDNLGLRKPCIWEYSRLNMTNTVLSKRKLTWFVQNMFVDGWDDPRMPTVRGVLRRGMTVEGLRQFIIAQGSSRSVVLMEWDKIWAINKKVIDPVAPRYTAVNASKYTPVKVLNANESTMQVAKHPKNNEVGNKTIWIAPTLLVDEVDAVEFKSGENVTFINWGNLIINEIVKEKDKIVQVVTTPNIEDKNYKKTLKITWLAETKSAPLIPVVCYYFDHIISKAILGKEEDFKQYIGHETKFKVEMLGEPELAQVKKSDIIQLQRKGFFICDQPYVPPNKYTFKTTPLVLIYIPDGHSKGLPADLMSLQKKNLNSINDPNDLIKEFKNQEQKVNNLLKDKKDTAETNAEIEKLISLRELCEAVLVQGWNQVENDKNKIVNDILVNITSLGDKIRKLKADKADKHLIQENVKTLLELKASYKAETGTDWKPGLTVTDSNVSNQVSKVTVIKEPLDKAQLSMKIAEVGIKIRKLKADKAEKSIVDEEVKCLLKLKGEYKSLTGTDWKPEDQSNAVSSSKNNTSDINELLTKITQVGNKIRALKAEKSDKNLIDEEVKLLLQLKANYKNITGDDWKPGMNVTKTEENESKGPDVSLLSNKIKCQGDKVRELKANRAEKTAIDAEVKALLALKADYKSCTGKDWVPESNVEKSNQEKAVKVAENNLDTAALIIKIKDQGNIVRVMKSSTTSKEELNEAIGKLLQLKSEYKSLTGQEFPSEGKSQSKKGRSANGDSNKKVQPQKVKTAKQEIKVENETTLKKITRLGLEAKKEENLPEWYSQIITKSELIEYYDISGCYILRPWSFAIWESIKDFIDIEIKKMGVKNCYFPIFVSKAVLEKEKTHIADFAPEVAWVTKSGDSDLAEPIAIRPTSETVMYPAYAKWIQSYRDLPIKLNQWNNVVRWEFKHPQPFLRTREFLWQEGHTAFATFEEAEPEVYTALDLYASVYTDLLAVPVVKGRKTEKEKFAGGEFTLTVEAYISASGRAIQGATSHHLGQNFSKMFEIIFEDPTTQEKKYVFQNSWGLTTRTIGVLIMVHADNQGLVLPPRVASIQVVIIPCGITANLKQSDKDQLLDMCNKTANMLKQNNIRCEIDGRDNYSPGWKFNHWELKGVPVRVEIGPKDMQQQQIVAVRRDNGQKLTIPTANIINEVTKLLDNIQSDLLAKATEELKKHMIICKDWNTFCQQLDKKNILLSPFCGNIDCEGKIKDESAKNDPDIDTNAPSMGAKSLCIPFEQPAKISSEDKCIHPACMNKPQQYCLFGRSY